MLKRKEAETMGAGETANRMYLHSVEVIAVFLKAEPSGKTM